MPRILPGFGTGASSVTARGSWRMPAAGDARPAASARRARSSPAAPARSSPIISVATGASGVAISTTAPSASAPSRGPSPDGAKVTSRNSAARQVVDLGEEEVLPRFGRRLDAADLLHEAGVFHGLLRR